jgi:hypothetical protein
VRMAPDSSDSGFACSGISAGPGEAGVPGASPGAWASVGEGTYSVPVPVTIGPSPNADDTSGRLPARKPRGGVEIDGVLPLIPTLPEMFGATAPRLAAFRPTGVGEVGTVSPFRLGATGTEAIVAVLALVVATGKTGLVGRRPG